MTPRQFAAIRKRLGLSAYAMGKALGYEGNRNTLQVGIRKYESGERELPPWIARLAEMYDAHGVPGKYLPDA